MTLDATGMTFRTAALELKAAERSMFPVVAANIRLMTAPAIAAVKQSALDTLPKAGGLNQWTADAAIKTSVLTGARTAGVLIRARKTGHDLPAINRGVVRHPVFGNRKRKWSTTYVQPGFFTRPLDALEPALTLRMVAAMTETARIAGFH